MNILKLSSIGTSVKKTYKVEDGLLYIDNEPIEITGDDIVIWDVSAIEDFNSIERNDAGDIIIAINIFTDQATMNSFFSIVNKVKEEKLEDAGFPYKVNGDKIIWEASLEDLEGMEW